MQTFLPYESFRASAECLDRQRLGKQRVEVYQILRALTDPDYGWQNHPAVQMWRGFEVWLKAYGLIVCEEWISRGYKDNMRSRIREFKTDLAPFPYHLSGNMEFHRSHRSNLIRKLPERYRPLWPDVPDDLPYIWPSSDARFQPTGL